MKKVLRDRRFSHVARDVRFKDVPKDESKVKIDKRFIGMFTDKKFAVESQTDIRGKPKHFSASEQFKKIYDYSTDDNDEGDDDSRTLETVNRDKFTNTKKSPKIHHSEGCFQSDDDDDDSEAEIDCARGFGNIESSSSDESSDDESNAYVHPWSELDKEAGQIDECTRRLAVCNLAWNLVSANIIHGVLSSFAPSGRTIQSVKIYISDYGRKCLAEEDEHGPSVLYEVDSVVTSDNLSGKRTKDEERNSDLVRKYEMNRLKYYYAVVDCEDAATAEVIYRACDGTLFEDSGLKLDLRFIPDDMEFAETPVDVSESLAEITPFSSHSVPALNWMQSKVTLTWDKTDPLRQQSLRQVFNEADVPVEGSDDDSDVKKYLAPVTSDEETDGLDDDDRPRISDSDELESKNMKSKIAKYRNLLSAINQSMDSEEVSVEVTWSNALDSQSTKDSEVNHVVVVNEDELKESRSNKGAKKSKKVTFAETDDGDTVQNENNRILQQSYYEMPDNQTDDLYDKTQIEESNKNHQKHFDVKKLIIEDDSKKTKETVKSEDDFRIDVNDSRFEAVYTSHLYHIDPSNSKYIKTSGMLEIINEKVRRAELKESFQVTQQRTKRLKTMSEKTAEQGISSVDEKNMDFINSIKTRLLNQKRKGKMT